MGEFTYGKSICERCEKTFEWVGFRSRRNHISSPSYEVFTKPNVKKGQIRIDLSYADDKGNVLCTCPMCGYRTNVNVDK